MPTAKAVWTLVNLAEETSTGAVRHRLPSHQCLEAGSIYPHLPTYTPGWQS
jgi:hypothetical protein